MTRLTALIITSNYPDNILISSFENTEGKFGSATYLTRDDGDIHRILCNSKAVYNSKDEAVQAMHDYIKALENEISGTKETPINPEP